MSEIIQTIDNNINNLDNLKANEYSSNNKTENSESVRSSTSTSSIRPNNNDNLSFKSKLSLKNEELLDQSPNQRKLSAPASFSQNFVLNFIKLGKETRRSYFNQLCNKRLLNISEEENRKFKFNNIFIFDWDDTLLCTTVLSPCGYFDDNMIILPSKMEKIEKLEILVKKLLTKTIEKGDTYIITK